MSHPNNRFRMREHSKRRALERHQVRLNGKDLRSIAQLIQTNKGKFLERRSLDRSTWQVEYNNQLLKVVYSKRHKTVVTVLP